MLLSEIIDKLNLEVLCGNNHPDREVTGGYTGDLMSDVIAHTAAGNIWITMQVHLNIVAVAQMQELAAVVLVNNRRPEAEVLAKAEEKNVMLCVSSLSSFELAGQLYAMGLRGAD